MHGLSQAQTDFERCSSTPALVGSESGKQVLIGYQIFAGMEVSALGEGHYRQALESA